MIFAHALPTNQLIHLGIVRESPESDNYVYGPKPPALLNVCRELCAEASSWYYGNNIFSIRDKMFKPGVLSCLMLRRSPGIEWLRRVKIHHQHEIMFRCVPSRSFRDSVKYNVQFELFTQASRIEAPHRRPSRSKVEVPGVKVAFVYSLEDMYEPNGVCLCTLREMAEEAKDLIEVVLAYVGLVDAYEDKVKRSSTHSNGLDVVGQDVHRVPEDQRSLRIDWEQ